MAKENAIIGGAAHGDDPVRPGWQNLWHIKKFIDDYVIRSVIKGEPLSEILRQFMISLIDEDEVFTLEDRDSMVAVIDQMYLDSEDARLGILTLKIADGEIPVDAETRLKAFSEITGTKEYEPITEHTASMKALDYDDFLKTPYWRMVRAVVIVRAKGKCQVCNRHGSIHVHHRTYEHHGQEHLFLGDLIALCGSCHLTFHKNGRLVR